VIRTIRESDRWSLQTALIHLRHPETGRRVRLMAMIHIGEPVYYTRLNEIIAEHDGLVFFEGLGQISEAELAGLTPDERKVYDAIAPLNEAYRKLASALDLVAQPDALTKPGPHWIRADLPLKRLLTLWAERRLPLIPALETAGKALESAFFKRTTRLLLLQEPLILSAFRLVSGWSPALGRLTTLLVDERNDAAMATFDTTPADRDALLIYGAGHVPGLLAALTRRGYREEARDWFTAHMERIAFTDWFDVAADWWKRAGTTPRGPAAPARRR
jgi:hypothetical protein